jgi:hypothetical protein
MKPGDIVVPIGDSVGLLSESVEFSEFSIDPENIYYGYLGDVGWLCRGETGLVIEIQRENSCRVKLMIGTKLWWTNVSELKVLK